MKKESCNNEYINDNENIGCYSEKEFTPKQINISDYGISEKTQNKVNFYAEVPENDFFNCEAAIKSNTPFIVESRLAAMSLAEIGIQALAIEDFNKIPHLISKIKTMRNKANKCIVLMLNENGEALRQQEKIAKAFDESDEKIIYTKSNCYCGDEDLSINDRLMKDKDELKKSMSLIKGGAEEKIESLKKTKRKNQPKSTIAILNEIRNIKPDFCPKVLTGIKAFDEVTGGLGAGLHIISGGSSAGKTSFVVQLADEFARQGKKVLFFSLEMSAYELVSKSVSRIMYLQNGLKKSKTNNGERIIAKPYSSLYDPKARQLYTELENDAFIKAASTYEKEILPNICFYERDFKYNDNIIKVEEIDEIVNDNFQDNTNDIVVIIDYLQLLGIRYSLEERRAIDKCVTMLKDISHKYKIPVIVISSINRNAYLEQIDLSSVKASGMIEFSADTMIGLQLDGFDFVPEDKNESSRRARIYAVRQQALEAKESLENDVKIQLKVLKSRNGYQFDVNLNAKLGFGYFGGEENSDTDINGKKSVSSNSTSKTTRSPSKKTSSKSLKSIMTSDNSQENTDPYSW